MKIIPAIDILDGKCIRLTKGDFSKATHYGDDPLAFAKRIEDHGLEYLHLVDLDGAREGEVRNISVLEKIATGTSLKVDFSGGINGAESAENSFSAGANQIVIGSMAIKDPELFATLLEKFGQEKIILGADTRNGQVAYRGWQQDSGIGIIGFIENQVERGVTQIMSTSIAKDGALKGPDINLYKDILDHFDIQLIASGGVRSIEDVEELRQTGCSGVIIGKAFYEGRITLQEMSGLC